MVAFKDDRFRVHSRHSQGKPKPSEVDPPLTSLCSAANGNFKPWAGLHLPLSKSAGLD